MISGAVTADGEAVIRLEILGPDGERRGIEAVLDTGFNGSLTLPAHMTAALELPLVGERQATLADGSQVVLEMHLAGILWHEGREHEVLALRADGGPLIGMELLYGNRVVLNVVENGEVVIDALPENA
ncbi:MAG: clan AA aspartic protease [Rubrobacteraceae bacterium]